MRSKLRLFALVGVLATAVDFLLLIFLARGSTELWLADVIALVAAAVVAYVLNRAITFRGDPM
ncbi:MAG: GtrA family protein, partial [Acidimicrobiales bacterium]